MRGKYNIIILSVDDKPQFVGGIKRVTSILGKKWIEDGCMVTYLTLCRNTNINKSEYISFNGVNQIFIENISQLESTLDNILHASGYNCRNIILNPHLEDIEFSAQVIKIHRDENTKLISAFHFHPDFENDIIKHSLFSILRKNILQKILLGCALSAKFFLQTKWRNQQNLRDYRSSIYANSDLFVTLSDRFIPLLKKQIKSNEYSKLIAINNPSWDKNLTGFNIRHKQKIVLWSGRMDFSCKRIDRMLKIWQKISNKNNGWILKIIGSGNIEYIKSLAQSMGLQNVAICGFVNPVDYYQEASIICSTSTSEGWGMTLIEGSSYGCVPVAFDNGSIHDIINNGINGFIIDRFNISDYSVALDKLMSTSELLQVMSRNAFEISYRFEASSIANIWLEQFDKLFE